MANNLFVNGDFQDPDWKGWRVDGQSVKRVEEEGKYYALLYPRDPRKILLQTFAVTPGLFKLSLRARAWARDADTEPSRVFAYAALITNPQGEGALLSDFRIVTEAWLDYERVFEIPNIAGELRFHFQFNVGVEEIFNSQQIAQWDDRLLKLAEVEAGPVLAGQFVMEPLEFKR